MKPADLPSYHSAFRALAQLIDIGVFIVKQTAEAHGGAVTVQSTPGKGTTFFLRLPLVSTASPPRASTTFNLRHPA